MSPTLKLHDNTPKNNPTLNSKLNDELSNSASYRGSYPSKSERDYPPIPWITIILAIAAFALGVWW